MRIALAACVATLLAVPACDDGKPSGVRASGGAPPTASPTERARAFAARPLTAADVEAYLRLLPESRRAARNPADAKKGIEAEGWTVSEWVLLQARVNAAYVALQASSGGAAGAPSADVEVVRPFLPRLESALSK